jgi:hypothetical protein
MLVDPEARGAAACFSARRGVGNSKSEKKFEDRTFAEQRSPNLLHRFSQLIRVGLRGEKEGARQTSAERSSTLCFKWSSTAVTRSRLVLASTNRFLGDQAALWGNLPTRNRTSTYREGFVETWALEINRTTTNNKTGECTFF